ncbi:MAG: helix-turn-helix domain-containing protein [Burkholderiaceae bacterium]|nr:helix-turn-helix domain-containing protein [Burkholderiaceae bacterium]
MNVQTIATPIRHDVSALHVQRAAQDGCQQIAFPSIALGDAGAQWTPRRIRRGTYLYRAGMPSTALFVVRFGCLKSSLPGDDGEELVLDFPMRGDLLGADALAGQPCATDVQALEDSEVLVLPIADFETACSRVPGLRNDLYRHFGSALRREREHLMRLGGMRAAQRLARFLLDLSQRFAANGYSPRAFNLRMSRAEIGSYLGLTLESVSRLFSRFQDDGLIKVHLREIELIDIAALRSAAAAGDGSAAAWAAPAEAA